MCIVFREEIKWTDAPILIYDRTYFWQQLIWTISLLWQCLLATAFTRSTTLQIGFTVSQSDWHKVGSVDGESTNRGSRNWRSKMYGKTKRSWSMINLELQVDRRSVNRRSNLIWLVTEQEIWPNAHETRESP